MRSSCAALVGGIVPCASHHRRMLGGEAKSGERMRSSDVRHHLEAVSERKARAAIGTRSSL